MISVANDRCFGHDKPHFFSLNIKCKYFIKFWSPIGLLVRRLRILQNMRKKENERSFKCLCVFTFSLAVQIVVFRKFNKIIDLRGFNYLYFNAICIVLLHIITLLRYFYITYMIISNNCRYIQKRVKIYELKFWEKYLRN